MVEQLDGIAIFVAVAEEKGFRAAGRRLGISGSAVSQALRNMEERLGVALAHRTTRHVRLTEAGEQLYAAVRPALNDVESAIANVMELGVEPSGTLRLNVAAAAELVVLDEYCPPFPGLHLFYPRRRHATPALRALIDYVRGFGSTAASAS